MQKIDKNELNNKLYELFAAVDSVEDFRVLLEDLCTYNEVEQMAQRLECARQIMDGKTYNQIIAETDVSSATLSRVSRCVQHGSGGYTKVVKQHTVGKDKRGE